MATFEAELSAMAIPDIVRRPSGRDFEYFDDDAPDTLAYVPTTRERRASGRDAEVFEDVHSLLEPVMCSSIPIKAVLAEGELDRMYPEGKVMAKRTPSGRDMEFFEPHDEPMSTEAPMRRRTRSGRDEEFFEDDDAQYQPKALAKLVGAPVASTRTRRASGRDGEFDDEEATALAKAPLSRDYTSREMRIPSGRDAEYFDDMPAAQFKRRAASRDAELFEDESHLGAAPIRVVRPVGQLTGRDLEF